MDITSIIEVLIALLAGIGLGKLIFAKNTQRKIEEAESQSQQIINEAQLKAETLKKEKILEAKEKFVQLKAEYDKEALERNRKMNDGENRIKQKEIGINQKDASLERQIKENEAIKENLNRQLEVVAQKRNQLEKHQEEHIKRLEKIAGLTAEEAKAQLIESLKQEAQTQALQLQQEVIEEARQKANKEARKIIIQSIQRDRKGNVRQTIEITRYDFQFENSFNLAGCRRSSATSLVNLTGHLRGKGSKKRYFRVSSTIVNLGCTYGTDIFCHYLSLISSLSKVQYLLRFSIWRAMKLRGK